MRRHLHLASLRPLHLLGITTAVFVMTNVYYGWVTHRDNFGDSTDKLHFYAAQSKPWGVQQYVERAKRSDERMFDRTPSLESSTEASYTTVTRVTGSSNISNGNNVSSAGDILWEYKNLTKEVDEAMYVENHVFEMDPENNSETWEFNLTNAVENGAVAQYKLCDSFCERNTSFVTRLNFEPCSHTDIWCYPCYCDQACVHYGDCCPSVGSTGTVHVGVPVNLCVEVNVGQWKGLVEVIESCPHPYNNTEGILENCTKCAANDSDAWEEFVISDDTHALYCNKYCALCHGESNLIPALQLECETAVNVQNVRSKSKFNSYLRSGSFHTTPSSNNQRNDSVSWNISYMTRTTGVQFDTDTTPFPPLVNVAQCKLSIPNEHTFFLRSFACRNKAALSSLVSHRVDNHSMIANETEDKIMESLCSEYSYPIQIRDTWHRNLFCALRNGFIPGRKTCYRQQLVYDIVGPINVLTSLKEPAIVHKTASFPFQQCQQDGQGWYDTVADTCRPVSCENGRHWRAGQAYCVHDVPDNSSIVYTYMLHLVFQPRTNSTPLTCSLWKHFVEDSVLNRLVEVMQELNITIYGIQRECYDKPTKIFVYMQFIRESDSGKNQEEFEMKLVDIFGVQRLAVNVSYNGVSVDLNMNLTSGFYNWSGEQTMLSFPNGTCCNHIRWYDLNLTSLYLGNLSSNRSSYYVEVPFGTFTLYAQVFLNETEYNRADNNVYNLTYANISLDVREVQEMEYGFVVPVIFLENIYREAGLVSELQEIEVRHGIQGIEYEILSFCCLLVSIISLIFLLTTYTVFSELRTLPGINTMFLAAWLLVAQVLLMVVPNRTEVAMVCRVLAMGLHYSWLCVVSWCSICSFHMFDVFVRQQDRMHMPHRHGWYLKRYTALAHTIPAIIVGVVVLCKAVTTGGTNLGYGGYVCYLNSVLLVGLAFVLPLALSIILNLVLLLLTARAVSRVQQQCVAGTGAERGSIHIYIGLSSLTGLCWMVALIAEIPGCEWLHYVSAVLNGLQGLHLALSYSCSQRVLRMWRRKLRWGKSRSEHSTSSSAHSRRTVLTSV